MIESSVALHIEDHFKIYEKTVKKATKLIGQVTNFS
jgi:hypothetical protein